MILGATLTPMDIIIAAVIIFGTYYGATQGIFKKTTMIVSILAGVILGIRFRGLVEGFLNRNFYMSISPEAISLLGFILAFVIVYILVNQLLVSLGGVLGRAKIGIDQALGALLGGGLTTFVLSILLMLSAKVNFPPAENVRDSVLYPPVRNFAPYILGVSNQMWQNVRHNIALPPQSPEKPTPQDDDPSVAPQKPSPIR